MERYGFSGLSAFDIVETGKIVREEIANLLINRKTHIYPNVKIRGIQGRVYYCPNTYRIVGIHTEGQFSGQIMKAQPISKRQVELLENLNIID